MRERAERERGGVEREKYEEREPVCGKSEREKSEGGRERERQRESVREREGGRERERERESMEGQRLAFATR
jgi:hypothetical protein